MRLRSTFLPGNFSDGFIAHTFDSKGFVGVIAALSLGHKSKAIALIHIMWNRD